MSFTYPLGLLALIGIPIVIIIYILRNKYNEQTVSSTYIWKLSDKFLKRRNPLSGLTGLISLILQILTIAAIAFAICLVTLVINKFIYPIGKELLAPVILQLVALVIPSYLALMLTASEKSVFVQMRETGFRSLSVNTYFS